MPLLGAFGGNLPSLLLWAEIIVDLGSVVLEPEQVCGQRSLRCIWVLGRALCSLRLALVQGSIGGCKRDSGFEKAGKIELVDVEAFTSSENGIRVRNVRSGRVFQCAFESQP